MSFAQMFSFTCATLLMPSRQHVCVYVACHNDRSASYCWHTADKRRLEGPCKDVWWLFTVVENIESTAPVEHTDQQLLASLLNPNQAQLQLAPAWCSVSISTMHSQTLPCAADAPGTLDLVPCNADVLLNSDAKLTSDRCSSHLEGLQVW